MNSISLELTVQAKLEAVYFSETSRRFPVICGFRFCNKTLKQTKPIYNILFSKFLVSLIVAYKEFDCMD
jgi:hypothetical protein